MNSWISAEEKPNKNGRYLVHILQSPFVAFAGLEKANHTHYISARDSVEYAAEAEYYNGIWEFMNVDGEKERINGSVKTNDFRDAVYQIRVVEWMNMPTFVPVKQSVEPFRDLKLSEDDRVDDRKSQMVRIDPRTAAFDNSELAELAKKRYRACTILYPCNYNKKGDTEYVEISNEIQFNALLDYYTDSITDENTGDISYRKPVSDGYDGDGIYRIRKNRSKMCFNAETGRTEAVPDETIISKINNVTEMFRSL